jgi:hypothetical protein
MAAAPYFTAMNGGFTTTNYLRHSFLNCAW